MVTSRREWLKTLGALSAGIPLSVSIANDLLGAPISESERKFIAGSGRLVRLGSNENPYGPSKSAREAIVKMASEFNRYPFDASNELKRLIAKHEGVAPEYILLGAGTCELLCLTGLGVGLEKGSILSANPTFPLMMNYASKFNVRWDKVDLDSYLVHDLDAMASAVRSDTQIVFVVNPNNPTGTIVESSKLKDFCIEVSKKTLVYSDEAYLEFLEPSEQVSMVELVKMGHDVVVSRTFSKIYGLAGLRIGYLVAKPDIIKKIGMYQTGIILNQAAIAAAMVSLGDSEFMAYTRKMNAAARKHLTDYLDKKKWIYGKSRTNVVFFPSPKSGSELLSKTESGGFQIRIWEYQDKEWCRVSIGTLEEMKSFTKAFEQIVSL
jgi:histidinol-phosphate aminotransferase